MLSTNVSCVVFPRAALQLFVAAIGMAGFVVGSASAETHAPSLSTGKIAFIRYGPNWPLNDIYVMNGDGKNVRRVTRTTTQWRGDPAWSPDGRRIAYEVMKPDSEIGIWIMKADGTGSRKVIKGGQSPTWSPNGRRIAFEEWDSSGSDASIYTARVDGSGVRKVTDEACSVIGCEDDSPAWSPDGRRITFLRYTRFRGELQDDVYVVAPTGRGLRRLTRTKESEGRLAWSLDGTKIAYVGGSSFGLNFDNLGLYVMNADGSGKRRLTRGFHVNSPTWSPDGRSIAFGRLEDIYAINADGSNVRRLVRDGYSPAWTRTTR